MGAQTASPGGIRKVPRSETSVFFLTSPLNTPFDGPREFDPLRQFHSFSASGPTVGSVGELGQGKTHRVQRDFTEPFLLAASIYTVSGICS